MESLQQHPKATPKIKAKHYIIALSTIVLGLCITLCVHIYFVTLPDETSVNTTHQLARIDFNGNLTAQEQQAIQSFVKNLPGIIAVYMNTRDNILVYVYDRKRENLLHQYKSSDEGVSECVYRLVKNSGLYSQSTYAQRYIVQPTTAGSCPVNADQLSFYRKVSATIHGVFQ